MSKCLAGGLLIWSMRRLSQRPCPAGAPRPIIEFGSS